MTICPVCGENVPHGQEVEHGKRHRNPVREEKWRECGAAAEHAETAQRVLGVKL